MDHANLFLRSLISQIRNEPSQYLHYQLHWQPVREHAAALASHRGFRARTELSPGGARDAGFLRCVGRALEHFHKGGPLHLGSGG